MAHGPALFTARGVNIYVGSEIRDSLSLLDVLYPNQFEGESFDPELLEQTEKNFYRGAPPKWLNFHISEQAESRGRGLSLIKRDGYDTLMQQIQQRRKRPGVSTVKLSHQPGCGGTTLAMQVMWDLRKTFRCAVLTGSFTETRNVAKEVVQLYKAGCQDQHNTVLLLLNDEQIMENLQDHIMEEIAEQKIAPRMAVVIFFSCVRKDVVMHSDHVVLKRALSDTEKQKFHQKMESLSEWYTDQYTQFHGFNIMQTDFSEAYVSQASTVFSNVRKANRPPKTQLAAFLALLNAYVPGSYLLESQCLDFLKLKDSTYGELTLEDRMKPFSHLIISYQQDPSSEKRVRMAHTLIAQSCTELMAEAGVTRSDTARNFLNSLCSDEVPPSLLGFVKDMLTKRETKTEASHINSAETEETRRFEKEMFSRLILDIQMKEGKVQSASVLKVASGQFSRNAFFPQALSRVYYLELKDYNQAEMWAKRAKERDPQNSFIADTLGQVYKTHLKNIMSSGKPHEILHLAKKAIEAFKEEEQLAENEHGTHMKGDGNSRVSRYFNTSGKFGYVEVCNIVHDILHKNNVSTGLDRQINKLQDLVNSLGKDAKKHCDFLNAFLTYSKPGMQKENSSYNRKAVSYCYRKYVEYPLPDLVIEIVKKFLNNVKAVSSRGDNAPDSYIVALLKGWPTNSNRKSCNLMELIEKMKKSYKSAYAKYFRSRYLCPLLYFGKDDKGALNIIVPTEKVGPHLTIIKFLKSTDTFFECQKNLFRFNGVIKNYSIFATVGGMEIVVKPCRQNRVWKECEVSFYLGFTIRGLVAFDIQTKATEKDSLRSCTSCDMDLDSNSWTKVTPTSTTENDVTTYSFQSKAGRFECSVSALRWVCMKNVSFTYQFRSWEDHQQKLNMVQCTPGGPLLDITITDGKLDEVYLPHWICAENFSADSDKFSVLYRGKFEVTSSHVKLFQPDFSTNGVLIRAGFPLKMHCNVLICQTNEEFLTLRVHLIPRDPALLQELKQKEKASGYTIIHNANLKKSFHVLDFVSLTSDAKTAKISPAKIQLRHERSSQDVFTVFIKSETSDFILTLHQEGEPMWSCKILKSEVRQQR